MKLDNTPPQNTPTVNFRLTVALISLIEPSPLEPSKARYRIEKDIAAEMESLNITPGQLELIELKETAIFVSYYKPITTNRVNHSAKH